MGRGRKIDVDQLDADILNAIRNFGGIPTANALRSSGALRYGINTILDRFKANSQLSAAFEKRGLEYIAGLSLDELKEKTAKTGGGLLTNCSRYHVLIKRLVQRIDDEIILPEIKRLNGVPNPKKISKVLPYAYDTILFRWDANRERFEKAAEECALRYINGLGPEQLEKETDDLVCSFNFFSESVKRTITKALYSLVVDKVVLPKIKSFDGIPVAHSLSSSGNGNNCLIYSHSFLLSLFRAYPELETAAEKRALDYVTSLSIDGLKSATRKGGLTSICNSRKTVAERLYERIDMEVILSAIRMFDGIPSRESLAEVLLYSDSFVRSRLNENPILFIALAEKQGLTIDQAVELALGRGDSSSAVESIMNTQLKNLFAFREMLGISRIFSDLFEKAKHILEVSLYPAPLGKAIEFDGTTTITGYANSRRDLEVLISQETAYDLVILQGIHRISQEDFNKMILELRKTLSPGTSVIATYPKEYGMHESMPDALRKAGYEFKDSGILEVQPPDALGDAKLRTKLLGQSNVLHLVVSETEPVQSAVPNVIKISELTTDSAEQKQPGNQVNIPDYVLKGIQSVFVPSIGFVNLPGQPLLVTITDDNDKQIAVVGFDMNDKRPRKMELGKYPDARSIDFDFRGFAKQLIRDATLRANLGVKPGNELKLKLSKIPA